MLTKLVLSGNLIKDKGAIALGEALKSNNTLKELELRGCMIGAEGGTALASALGMAVLSSITLDGEALPVKKLKGTEPVETLDLSGQGLGVLSAIVIAKLIEFNAVLNKLVLSLNNIKDEGAVHLASAQG